jgi:type II secretory pathway component PulF
MYMDDINLLSRQKGTSMWGLLFGAALFVLFALITMKMVPAYLDNNKIISALDSVSEQPGVGNWSRRQIINRVSDTLYIDMASDMLDLNEALTIRRQKNTKVISIDYDRVIPMAFNISALLDFENSVEVSLR